MYTLLHMFLVVAGHKSKRWQSTVGTWRWVLLKRPHVQLFSHTQAEAGLHRSAALGSPVFRSWQQGWPRPPLLQTVGDSTHLLAA